MRNFIRLASIIAFAVIGVIVFQGQDAGNNNNPDWDSPVLDRKPMNLIYGNTYTNPNPEFDHVVTADGFENFDLGPGFGEVHMGMNPTNRLFMVAAYNSSGSVGTVPFVTSNGGLTWGVVNPTWGTTMAGDPAVVYDSLGNVFHENMQISGANIIATRIARSSTNGFSWQGVAQGNVGNDKNWMAADQTGGPYRNYLYSTMTNGSSCNFARSTDGGLTFNVVTALVPHGLPGAMPCVGPNGSTQGGSVYVVTNAGSSFAAIYTFFRSTDGGATFNQQSQVNWVGYVGTNVGGRNSVENMRTRPYPFISADNSYGPYRGRLYCLYATNMPAGDGNKPDIFCRYSTDFGATWSSEVKVNDDAGSENNHQWHPAMWCDKTTGRLYASWMDTRNTPTSDSAEIYGTYSTDGGATFVTNQKLSNAKMKINCASCPGGGTPRYQGDYNSVTSMGNISFHTWTDFRFNGFGSFGSYFPDFAMLSRPTIDTLRGKGDTTFFWVSVPATKLYSGKIKFSYSISSGTDSIKVEFLNKTNNVLQDSITTIPDSLRVRVFTKGTAPITLHSIHIDATGTDGPIHRRSPQVRVLPPIGIVNLGTEVPQKFSLEQNYPNPFNPKTSIKFDLAKTGLVKLVVYDITGRQVSELVNGVYTAGQYRYDFNASELASGIYFYKLVTADFTDVKKMILVK